MFINIKNNLSLDQRIYMNIKSESEIPFGLKFETHTEIT